MSTTIDLRKIVLRPGEQFDDVVEVQLESLELGRQVYSAGPQPVPARLAITRATGGLVFRLRFEASVHGPCFRCLEDARLTIVVDATEYEDADARGDEELQSSYLANELLDVSAWAHDAVALALPDTILCAEDCAGLCAQCGIDLNHGSCGCAPPPPEGRWQELQVLREQLED